METEKIDLTSLSNMHFESQRLAKKLPHRFYQQYLYSLLETVTTELIALNGEGFKPRNLALELELPAAMPLRKKHRKYYAASKLCFLFLIDSPLSSKR